MQRCALFHQSYAYADPINVLCNSQSSSERKPECTSRVFGAICCATTCANTGSKGNYIPMVGNGRTDF